MTSNIREVQDAAGVIQSAICESALEIRETALAIREGASIGTRVLNIAGRILDAIRGIEDCDLVCEYIDRSFLEGLLSYCALRCTRSKMINMHEYMIEFRISGAELVPATITQALGLEPSHVRQVGELRSAGKVWDEALWGYNGFPDDTPKSWASLEDGLTFVLDRLEPLRREMDKYIQKYDAIWWCGHFQSSFDGGPTFSAKLLRRLAHFGVELYLDTHFVDSDSPDS